MFSKIVRWAQERVVLEDEADLPIARVRGRRILAME
jgi:hypothetical protein